MLRRDPICRLCGRAQSTVADHIVPRALGGGEGGGNLQGICAACSAGKTSEEANAIRAGRKVKPWYSRRVDAKGWPVDPRHPFVRHTVGAAILSLKEGQAMGEPLRIEVTEETGFGEVEVVGLRFYRDAMVAIAGDLREHQGLEVEAVLVLDNKNPHDPMAVRVDVQGKTVGHLSREDARAYREWLKEIGHPDVWAIWPACIRGGWDRGQGDRGHYGVEVYIGRDEAAGEGEDNL